MNIASWRRRFDVISVNRKRILVAAAFLVSGPVTHLGIRFRPVRGRRPPGRHGRHHGRGGRRPLDPVLEPGRHGLPDQRGRPAHDRHHAHSAQADLYRDRLPTPARATPPIRSSRRSSRSISSSEFPVNDRLELSFAFHTPFGLGTEWEDDFLGNYVAKRPISWSSISAPAWPTS